ncbi:Putative transporter, RarD family, DMT superfamily protein [Pseudooceanicola batsensis HTCC2597]|uniref:Putative transporter, RarD family, DMT superfamily protein n=1 Tax=Pseudooceanicola batsensis (strain ATCC BAA-863 / DSM 15984 / KCTC 12145 / HTCC2597) TaxID=252305 RepID=A3TWC4_PSEBH|nr:DMT family transporter [Pseudooceanicola batsensis]EAQ03920.1 Putative transporter, RarD family, DMT superfamily protein [Pseudooceanicola batsensis HTCC2597]
MQPLRGIAFKLIAVMCFITMQSLVKAVSTDVPAGESVFFRSLFALPVIIAWLALRGDLRTGLRVARPMDHVWRGFIGTCAMGAMFAGLAFLPLPEVTALTYAMPLLVVIFAAMFLNESVGIFRIGAVVLGLTGVLIVLAPRVTSFGGDTVKMMEAVGALIVLLGAVCGALAQIFIRKMVQTEEVSAIVFWFSCTSTGMALLTVPFGWVVPTPAQAVMLVLTGLVGGLGQIFLTSSYRFADASLVAPFDYASMLFAILIGYFVFAEVPTSQMLLGAALIIIAGIIIILRERQLGIRREKARQAKTPYN